MGKEYGRISVEFYQGLVDMALDNLHSHNSKTCKGGKEGMEKVREVAWGKILFPWDGVIEVSVQKQVEKDREITWISLCLKGDTQYNYMEATLDDKDAELLIKLLQEAIRKFRKYRKEVGEK